MNRFVRQHKAANRPSREPYIGTLRLREMGLCHDRRSTCGMSDILGQMMGSLAGAGGLAGLLTQVLGVAQGAAGGGLPALLQQLEAAGLGIQVESWVGPGDNLPITAEHIAAAIPDATLQDWAATAGLAPHAVSQVLAEILPQAVNHTTPDGVVRPATEADITSLVDRLSAR